MMRNPLLIQACSATYLRRLYLTLLGVILLGAIFLTFTLGQRAAIAMMSGSILVATAGYVGMNILVRANSRTVVAASNSIAGTQNAFTLAFRAGSVLGLASIGIALLGFIVLWQLTHNIEVLNSYGLGASFLALLAKVGGGVFTKAADVGADQAKLLGIEEDDPRNPAVIADQVGDNVGDGSGMTADATDTYLAALFAALARAVSLGEIYVTWTLLVGTAGLLATVFGAILFSWIKRKEDADLAMKRNNYATNLTFMTMVVGLSLVLKVSGGLVICTLAGAISMFVVGMASRSTTDVEGKSVRKVAEASIRGYAFNILAGMSVGQIGTVIPVLGIILGIYISQRAAGFFGLDWVFAMAIAAVGMLATIGNTISTDAFGPIVDNADGIGEMLALDGRVTKVTAVLDAAGNSVKAITKVACAGASAMAILAMLFVFSQSAGISVVNALTPGFIIGAYLGGLMPRIFTSFLFESVRINAQRVATIVLISLGVIQKNSQNAENEVDELKPYIECVDIVAKGAMKALIKPGLISLLAPIFIGFVLGRNTLAGFLFASVFTSSLEAIYQGVVGAAWDNAKKLIEGGEFGGKGSPAHQAAVVGDTVGDPHKDTGGPALETLQAVTLYVANLIAPYLKFAIFIL